MAEGCAGMRADSFFSLKMNSFLHEAKPNAAAEANEAQEFADRYKNVTDGTLQPRAPAQQPPLAAPVQPQPQAPLQAPVQAQPRPQQPQRQAQPLPPQQLRQQPQPQQSLLHRQPMAAPLQQTQQLDRTAAPMQPQPIRASVGPPVSVPSASASGGAAQNKAAIARQLFQPAQGLPAMPAPPPLPAFKPLPGLGELTASSTAGAASAGRSALHDSVNSMAGVLATPFQPHLEAGSRAWPTSQAAPVSFGAAPPTTASGYLPAAPFAPMPPHLAGASRHMGLPTATQSYVPTSAPFATRSPMTLGAVPEHKLASSSTFACAQPLPGYNGGQPVSYASPASQSFAYPSNTQSQQPQRAQISLLQAWPRQQGSLQAPQGVTSSASSAFGNYPSYGSFYTTSMYGHHIVA
eukprot:TRINITY_DN13671_c2_g1_i1.p1 TRINITY_DN13671_c2_g1~~TRINITY_DN13671_c2_g1_i1.p1  ORF type:complete len:445 (-),score=83.29 TRINITY_DN13671_c2_g1_i1:83-1300(-)